MCREIDKDGAERLMSAVIQDAVKASVSAYKKGLDNSHNERFFRDNFMVAYMLPNLSGDDIIKALKTQAKEQRA